MNTLPCSSVSYAQTPAFLDQSFRGPNFFSLLREFLKHSIAVFWESNPFLSTILQHSNGCRTALNRVGKGSTSLLSGRCYVSFPAVIVVAHFLQSVTSRLVLGGEMVYHRRPGEEGAIVTLAGKYTGWFR